MLKAIRGPLLVLGLTPEEVEHLKTGHPLKINLGDVGAEGSHAILFMGRNNEEMRARFERSGLAAPGDKVDLNRLNLDG